MSQYPDCAGRVALVTGAAGGIGAAVTNALAAEGARVAAVDRDADPLELLVKAARSENRAITAYPLDITDRNRIGATVESPCRPPTPSGTARRGQRHGVFGISRVIAGRMVPRRDGTIVTVASNAAGVPRSGMAAYAASKAAATAFTRCLGLELAKYGIRCNVGRPRFDRHAHVSRSVVGLPLGRIAEPSDVADTSLVPAVKTRPTHHDANRLRRWRSRTGRLTRSDRCRSPRSVRTRCLFPRTCPTTS